LDFCIMKNKDQDYDSGFSTTTLILSPNNRWGSAFYSHVNEWLASRRIKILYKVQTQRSLKQSLTQLCRQGSAYYSHVNRHLHDHIISQRREAWPIKLAQTLLKCLFLGKKRVVMYYRYSFCFCFYDFQIWF
jgi:hypothetical protein